MHGAIQNSPRFASADKSCAGLLLAVIGYIQGCGWLKAGHREACTGAVSQSAQLVLKWQGQFLI